MLSRPSALLRPLRLPLGTDPLPGDITGYRASGSGKRSAVPGPRRASPVPAVTFSPFHAPYPGGFLDAALQALHAFHGLRPSGPGSAPSSHVHDAAGFASRCGPASRTTPRAACHPASTPTCQPTPGTSYRAPWRLPGPDSHRLATTDLRPDQRHHLPRPGLLGTLPSSVELRWRPGDHQAASTVSS
jgi:hypothetical protein